MKKKYEAPELFCDEYVPDTMIASGGDPGGTGGGGELDGKNGHAGNNQNCWGCDGAAYSSGKDNCFYIPSMGDTYKKYCE